MSHWGIEHILLCSTTKAICGNYTVWKTELIYEHLWVFTKTACYRKINVNPIKIEESYGIQAEMLVGYTTLLGLALKQNDFV